MQFFRVDKNTAEGEFVAAFIQETNPSDEVMVVLKSACFDCHSNSTNYPWYAEIAPVSYWIDEHIEHGKEELNFSNWAEYSVKRKDHKMEELIEEVKKKHMPLDSYTWIHSDANLTDAQITAVTSWAAQYRSLLNLSGRPQ